MKAYYIRTIAGLDRWHIIGSGQDFYSDWSIGHTKEQIEQYYND